MYRHFPILIESTSIPFPDSWEETAQKITTEFETENGHRKLVVVRSARMSFRGTFTVTNRWLKKFRTWRNMDAVGLSVYDAKTDAYKTYTVSFREDSFRYTLIKGSERMTLTDGLYNLSFELEEF